MRRAASSSRSPTRCPGLELIAHEQVDATHGVIVWSGDRADAEALARDFKALRGPGGEWRLDLQHGAAFVAVVGLGLGAQEAARAEAALETWRHRVRGAAHLAHGARVPARDRAGGGRRARPARGIPRGRRRGTGLGSERDSVLDAAGARPETPARPIPDRVSPELPRIPHSAFGKRLAMIPRLRPLLAAFALAILLGAPAPSHARSSSDIYETGLPPGLGQMGHRPAGVVFRRQPRVRLLLVPELRSARPRGRSLRPGHRHRADHPLEHV